MCLYVFNGKGGFNGKFFAMLCGMQAGRFCVCLWKLQIYSCAKSGGFSLNSNDFLIETHYKANAFATVFNGNGGFNGKFFAMLCGVQAGRFLFVY